MITGFQVLLRLLQKRCYRISGYGIVRARLWRVRFRRNRAKPDDEPSCACLRDAYAVELNGLGSRAFRLVGCDEERARAIWALLVRNTVTPCALSDVLEEL